MTTTYEIGYSIITGDYFVIIHDGPYGHGEYKSLDEAKDRIREMEEASFCDAPEKVRELEQEPQDYPDW